MKEFKEFTRFPDIETAKAYTTLLEEHNIPFVLDDTSLRFKLVSTDNPYDNQLILKIKEEDRSKVESLFDTEIESEPNDISPEHYLNTFDDKGIVDIIANQNEWSKTEVNIALNIAKERNLDLSFDSLAKSKKQKTETETETPKLTMRRTVSWLYTFGLFSILNSLFLRLDINFRLPGLSITELTEHVAAAFFGEFNRIGFVITLIIAAVFFFLAKFGKHNKWIFLSGLILLSLDTVLRAFTFNWFFILFNFMALWGMTNGFINDWKAEKKVMT
jgi:hypothetical protein